MCAHYIFSPSKTIGIPVLEDDALFPVRQVYCVGRNYAEHAKEMGHDPEREPPFFFKKCAENIVTTGEFPYPTRSSDVHHEVELVVALKSGGSDIKAEEALQHVMGYAVGLDMTRRDLQGQMKKGGKPWEIGKAFDHSAPLGVLSLASACGHIKSGAITLSVNGVVKQSGDVSQMTWNIPELICHLSSYFELYAGDLIFTGTPAGVGPVKQGDELVATVNGLPELTLKVV